MTRKKGLKSRYGLCEEALQTGHTQKHVLYTKINQKNKAGSVQTLANKT